jgi:hypothetical protein
MSSPVSGREASYDAAYGRIRIPCMHMTGTEDVSPLKETTAAERRVPYDHSRLSDQYLMTFAGGNHLLFSGATGKNQRDAGYLAMIRALSTAFFDSRLRQDAAATAWLDDPKGFAAMVGPAGVYEHRAAATPAPPAVPKP